MIFGVRGFLNLDGDSSHRYRLPFAVKNVSESKMLGTSAVESPVKNNFKHCGRLRTLQKGREGPTDNSPSSLGGKCRLEISMMGRLIDTLTYNLTV